MTGDENVIYGKENMEAISKKSFRPISALSPRIKSSTYLSMRVGDPVTRGGLILGLAFRLHLKGMQNK